MRKLSVFLLWFCSVLPLAAVEKPIGVFASAGAGGTGDNSIYGDAHLRGVLIRATWSQLERAPGQFDFSLLVNQASRAKAANKSWSLGVLAGGIGSPEWLTAPVGSGGLGARFLAYSFRGVPGYKLPFFWDPIVQERLRLLATRLAEQFNSDASLKLVYITQMTSNGIEGHLQGVNMNEFKAAPDGFTKEKWIAASKQVAHAYAAAFTNKALAFEVHDVDNDAGVPRTIINDLWNDPVLEQRVGAAMWWISGRTNYQAALVEALMAFPGDIYGQVIANSRDTAQFLNGDYTTVFAQAKQLRMRYIEPWDFEFTLNPNPANSSNRKWDAVFADFNAWADATFAPSSEPSSGPRARLVNLSVLTSLAPGDDSVTLGYAIGGAGTSGTKPLVVRAAGPSLAAFGVAAPLPDPKLEWFADTAKVGENDDWGGTAPLANAMSAVGAFAFSSAASKDAATALSVGTPLNSVRISSVNSGAGGTVLGEIYDATPPANDSSATPRLINLSVLKSIGSGLTAGFVLDGAGTRTVLIRAVGPTLGIAPLNVAGAIPDLRLALYGANQAKLAENDDWGGTATLTSAFTATGAFALPAGSKDAALLVTLGRGLYSVVVNGAAAANGIGLVEVYEVPER